jgi:predicted amidohydrolase YtcJ
MDLEIDDSKAAHVSAFRLRVKLRRTAVALFSPALAAVLLWSVVAGCRGMTAQTGAPDLIIHNARIYTVDRNNPRAEAIAIRGERIAFVGSNELALRLPARTTQVVDAGEATIVPGFHDAHAHFVGLGQSLQRLDLRGTASYEEVVDLVRQRAARAAPGEWILGRGWDQNLWPAKDWPTREPLDAVTPENPVFLTRVDGHAALVNMTAMRQAGLTRDTDDPPGGRIIRDPEGHPSGVLVDRAMPLVSAKIPPESPSRIVEQILLADRETRRLGLTTVHDAGTPWSTVEHYRQLIDDDRLQTRLYVMLRAPTGDLAPHFRRGPLVGHANHRLTVRAVKMSADGALGSRGAALLAPYSDEPATDGLLLLRPEEIYEQTVAASRAGFQTCIHAIGDRANRLALDIFERVQREVPRAKDLRLRVEHAQILHPSDIPRFGALGVIASMQSIHATSDMAWVPARIGAERAAHGAYVWQALMQSGATIANGSDFPVEDADPMLGFHAAVTRQDAAGDPPTGWMPDQRMTRDEALASFTLNAAYAAHLERELGSLEAGKLADLVVLSQDIMTVEPSAILETRVLKTIVGGRVVQDVGPVADAWPRKRPGDRSPSPPRDHGQQEDVLVGSAGASDVVR